MPVARSAKRPGPLRLSIASRASDEDVRNPNVVLDADPRRALACLWMLGASESAGRGLRKGAKRLTTRVSQHAPIHLIERGTSFFE